MRGGGFSPQAREAALLRLQRRAEQLEGALEERAAQLRAAEDRAARLEEGRARLAAQLEQQQLQGKVAVKRCEELLGHAEEVAVYGRRFAAATVEVLERALEALAGQREVDLAAVWARALPAAEVAKMRRSLAVLTGSRRLQSRNLFTALRVAPGFDALLNLAGVQQQVRRIAEDAGGGTRGRLSVLGQRRESEMFASRLEQLEFSQVLSGGEGRGAGEGFLAQAKALVELLSARPPAPLRRETFAALAEQARRVEQALRGYLLAVGGELRAAFPALAEERAAPLPEHQSLLRAREAAQRLASLRDTFEHLLRQGAEAAAQVTAKDFRLLELDQLLVALERDAQAKAAEAAGKERQLQGLQAEVDALEQRLGALLRERFEREERRRALAMAKADLSAEVQCAAERDLAGQLLAVDADVLRNLLAEPPPADLSPMGSAALSPSLEEQLRGRIAARMRSLLRSLSAPAALA